MPYPSMWRCSVPSSRISRVMLSSQRLWPMSRRDCRWVMSIPSVWCEFRGSAGRRLAAGPWSELLQVEGGQFADVVDGQVRRRVECLPGGLVRVVPLAHEDGGQAVAQHALHGGQQLRLVVDHHVVARGIAPLDRVEHVLLVQVDQHPAPHRLPQARALHLARLEHHVRSEEHTSELQSLMRISYAVFCL